MFSLGLGYDPLLLIRRYLSGWGECVVNLLHKRATRSSHANQCKLTVLAFAFTPVWGIVCHSTVYSRIGSPREDQRYSSVCIYQIVHNRAILPDHPVVLNYTH